MNKYDKKHLSNIDKYQRQIDTIYKTAIKEASKIAGVVKNFDSNKLFSFDDYPETKKLVDSLLNDMASSLNVTIVNGVQSEWTLANNKNNELCNQVFGDNVGKLSKEAYKRCYSSNPDALEAFTKRKTAGLNLSDRVWNNTDQFKDEIELALDLGIGGGVSAAEIARDLKQYLKHPDMLFRRVRDKHGNLVLSQRAKNYHPGRGVYRSSYKNARRLAATETNMAYRTADYERWSDMDFVVGIEVKLSNNHNCKGVQSGLYSDICDELKGKYPKDFKFVGWHPHCRCHAEPILKTADEFLADDERIAEGKEPTSISENSVTDVPSVFNKWIDDNRERAKGWASMPYFVRDNPQYVSDFRVGTYSAAEKKFTRAYHTSPAMKESLALFLDKKYPDIKNTEKAALIDYTRGDVSDFRHLNKELMNNSLSEFNVAFSELLSSALAKLPNVEATVYRAIRLNRTNLNAWKLNAANKAEMAFNGYTSTSEDINAVLKMIADKQARKKNNETDVLLIIKSKTGHRIKEFSKFPEQEEILFDKGMRLKYDGMSETNGRIVFQMTEI